METKYNKEILIQSHVVNGYEPQCLEVGIYFPSLGMSKVLHNSDILKTFSLQIK